MGRQGRHQGVARGIRCSRSSRGIKFVTKCVPLPLPLAIGYINYHLLAHQLATPMDRSQDRSGINQKSS